MENQIEKQKGIDALLKKVAESKKGKLDLSSDEDLSIAIMNLISIEEHFFFTGVKTGKPEYYELLDKAREIRKELLKKIIKEYEGEVWCISKHLLAATMRLMEVGTKQFGQGNKAEANDLFSKAYDLYSLFWGLNLKLLNVSDVKKIDDNQLNAHDNPAAGDNPGAGHLSPVKAKTGLFAKLNEIVKKVINCCAE